MKLGIEFTTLLALTAFPAAQHAQSPADELDLDPVTVPTSVEGVVLAPDGRPTAGATVVTSAGGKAVSAADGTFRLALELPLDAYEVRATALQSAGTVTVAGSARIAVAPGTSSSGAVLRLGDVDCEPRGVATFGGVATLEGVVYDMIVFDVGGGEVLVAGGNMSRAGGFPASGVATWDGATWSPLGIGMDAPVLALEVFDDGSGPALYAAGMFTTASGSSANYIVRWDGTSWSALGTGLDNVVQALQVFDDGSGPALYAGGAFTTAGGVAASHVARWDGTTWSALGAGTSTSVLSLAALDDGSGPALYAGGNFTLAGGVGANRIARWDGTSWSALGSGVNDRVLALAGFDDGSGMALYAGGEFTMAGGAPASRIAKWDGTSWSPLSSGTTQSVEALCVFDDGGGPQLHAGGFFSQAGGVAARRVARWDGTSWSALGDGSVSHGGTALVVFDDGSGDGPELYTQSWAWNGTDWQVLTQDPPPINNDVWALAVLDSGAGESVLYAGGEFTNAGGTSVSRVARWDGAWQPDRKSVV